MANKLEKSVEKGVFPSRDGTPIYYEIRGKGRPLVFCYGLTCRIEHWRFQLERFSSRYQVVAFDYRGHHRSSTPEDERHLTLEWLGHDVVDLLAHLGHKEAVCLGHSLGAAVAAQAAVQAPDKVKGLVFVCGSLELPFKHMFHTHRLEPVFRLTSALYGLAPGPVASLWKKLTKRNWLNTFVISQFGFNPQLSEKRDVTGYLDGVHESPFQTFHHLMKDYDNLDTERLLSAINCPTLIIAGEEDLMTPISHQEKISRVLKDADLQKIPGGSHNAHMDCPRMVNLRVYEFLNRIKY